VSGPFYDRRGHQISLDEWGRLHEGLGWAGHDRALAALRENMRRLDEALAAGR